MKKKGIGKRAVLVVILLALCTFQAAAQDNSFGLDDKVGMSFQMLSSPWGKGIACTGLITTGRQEPGMFKKFIPWIPGTILFMAAGTITSRFVNIETTAFNEALE
jgi:type IV secretory pathway VirB2 component (pilin)